MTLRLLLACCSLAVATLATAAPPDAPALYRQRVRDTCSSRMPSTSRNGDCR